MPSATLRPEDKTIIRNAIGHACQIFTATIVRLYLTSPADPGKWVYTKIMGAAAFMKDTRRNDSFFLRIVDLQSGRVVWEQELYRDFQYFQEKPFFHSFATDTCMAGLSFADENEATAFYNKVLNRDNLRVQPRTSRGATRKKGKIDKSQIGAPSNFRHLTHIGWDPDRGFSTINIPPEWKKVFERAGVTEEQLQDKNTAKFIFDFMQQHVDGPESAAPTGAVASTPAPPLPATSPPPPVITGQPPTPVASHRQPPPAPPARGNAPPPPSMPSRNVPPPPPSRNVPALPSRGPVSPTVIPEPPQAPPIPPAGNAPPPPPPPPMPPAATGIMPPPPPQATATPKPAIPKAAPDGRNALLESIRSGGTLKPVKRSATPALPTSKSTDLDMASALRVALASRQTAMGPTGGHTDSENDEEEDEDW